ncbi:hypothetical protein GGF46_005138 [Coemansia sp. RSA 552]|nr:hypothetical protein GGF46_005138 [Coemansia sp. RSA 552]
MPADGEPQFTGSEAPAISGGIPFENLAQNLPEAFAALEGQLKDPAFQSNLVSKLDNPKAVELFQSMIHDPNAASSISSLLDDPGIQSSLSVQFVEEYLSFPSASRTQGSHGPEATDDAPSNDDGDSTGHSLKSQLESMGNGASRTSQALVMGPALAAILGVITLL